MEYQKIINLLDNTPNQQSKFMTKNWVEINNDSRGTYNTNSQIRFKASIPKSRLFNYSDAYIRNYIRNYISREHDSRTCTRK